MENIKLMYWSDKCSGYIGGAENAGHEITGHAKAKQKLAQKRQTSESK